MIPMSCRRISIICAFILFASGSAIAADMAVKMPVKAPPPPPAPVYNWTGFYIGGNFGGGWGHTNANAITNGTLAGSPFPEEFASSSISASGILGGGQLGFNYEFVPHWVAGVEADIDWAHITGSGSTCEFAAGLVTSCSNAASKIDDFGTVRGRLGYAFGNVLLYGTGGFAWANHSNTITLTCQGPLCPGTTLPFATSTSSDSSTPEGWTAGGGVEWLFLPNWTIRAEYLHLQFNSDSQNFSFTGTITVAPLTVFPLIANSNASLRTGVDIVRVGVNYLFH
jgi:outer membrane immunogenic protein